MSYHPAFTAEQWENSPQYTGPGNHELHQLCDATILDFDQLKELAGQAEQMDAFHEDGLGVARAPLRLGHIPAAFYRVVSKDFDIEAVHVPDEDEILVVLDGVLSVIGDRELWTGRDEYDFALIPGQVKQLRPQSASRMRALGFEDPESLALSVFRRQLDSDKLVISSKGRPSREKTSGWDGAVFPQAWLERRQREQIGDVEIPMPGETIWWAAKSTEDAQETLRAEGRDSSQFSLDDDKPENS